MRQSKSLAHNTVMRCEAKYNKTDTKTAIPRALCFRKPRNCSKCHQIHWLTCQSGIRAAGREQNIRKQLLERVSVALGPILHVVPDRQLQSPHKGRGGRAQLFHDLGPLVNVVCAREQHGTSDHLAEDTTNRPDINCKSSLRR